MNELPENITHELIVAFLKGETTNEESLMIQSWIDSWAENKKYFDNISTIWFESGELNPIPVDVNVDEAWENVSSRIEEKKQFRSFAKTLLKVAAALILILVFNYFYFNHNKDPKQIAVVSTNDTIQKRLSDGSLVQLNSYSKLTYPETFAENIREVTLEGEAFFEVTPNKEQAFLIHSNNATIKVVGTSFNVKSDAERNKVEVFVKSGKVLVFGISKLTGDTSMVELVAGEKGIYNGKAEKVSKVDIASENELFWMTKTLSFDKTELAEVIEVLQKNYNVEFEFKNDILKSLRLSATFSNQPIESVIEVISTTLNLKITKSNSIYEIDGEGN